MARKRSLIVRKAMNLIAFSVSPMAKARKPISRNLLLFKKAKRFHLLRHYNYAYVGEYEFSPSNTPLFRHPRPPSKKRSFLLSLLLCGWNGEVAAIEGAAGDELEALSAGGDGFGGWEALELPDLGEEDDVSVDRRAERFIERFYEEMSIQRQGVYGAV